MRERTPSADDTPKRAPPAPPREAASADAAGSKTRSEAAEACRAAKFTSSTTASPTAVATTAASSPSSVDVRMVASTHNLEDLGVSHPTSASTDRQQQQEKHAHTYRSAQTAQDKRSRLSNVINNLRKKVPDSRSGGSPRKEEDDRNSVERNLETLEKYVMTVLNGVIKDEEDDDREVGRKSETVKGKDEEKLTEDQEDEDSKGPAAKFEPSKPNESRTETAVFPSEHAEKTENAGKEASECQSSDDGDEKPRQAEESSRLEARESQEALSDDLSEEGKPCKTETVEDEEVSEGSKCSSKETKPDDQSVQETAQCEGHEEEKKESKSLGTIIMERLSDHQSDDKGNSDAGKEDAREFVSENSELRNVCRDLLNDLLNGINQLIDENSQEKEETKTSDAASEESKDSKSQDLSMTSLHCSLPLDKVASVLQNCQTNELTVPQSPSSPSSSSSSQGSKSPSKPPSPTVRHLCLYCDRKFLSISLRQRHTERVHQQGGGRRSERNSRKPSQNCQYCSDKCAESLEGLFQHMVGSHGDKYHACVQCSTRYLTREALAGHMSENHGVNVERNLQIQEKMKEPSPCKELGSQSPRDKTEPLSPKDKKLEDSDHGVLEHRTESILLKPPIAPPKDTFSNPGSPEFDSSFYSSVSCNIRENLLHHLDGKLQSSSSSVTSATASVVESKPQQQQTFYEHNQIQFPIDISLTAATPVYSKEYATEEYENSSEYAQKPGKSNRSHPRRVSFEKYNFPRKYDGKEQWTCSIKDISKFDISTQLSLRKKQQLLKERVTLNRLHQIPILGPSETTDVAQDEPSASFEQPAESENVEEASAGRNGAEVDTVARCDAAKSTEMKAEACGLKSSQITEFSLEFGNFLRLRRWDEKASNDAAKKQEAAHAELTGEWSRPRVYICGACGSKHVTLKEMEDHKASSHPNVWCSHFEFSGDQRELYKHLFLPGRNMPTAKAKTAILAEKVCSKCSRNCNTLPELHRHMLECGGDQAWLLGLFGNGKKKCKWRPFGSRSRRRRQRGMKRNIQNSQTPRVNTPKEKQPTGPRVRPSDRESIQKMLANLPPKRATRKVMQDSTLRAQGRLRNVQTRSRPRMVGDNTTASRMSRNKAALRNKLLKNAKSIQRNRCRIDNISAVIESVVKSYISEEKKSTEEKKEEEKSEVKKDAKEKTDEEAKKESEPGERRGRTKMVRGPRVLSKKRNVRAKEGPIRGMHQAKRLGNLKTKVKSLSKNALEAKSLSLEETVGTSKAVKVSPKGDEKETEESSPATSRAELKSPSPSAKNKSFGQTTPKRKRPVDPVASLNASIKAKSQLRTQDGKFARNPNKSMSPQKSPEIRPPIVGRHWLKGRASETSPESSVTRSKWRAVSRNKNDELPKRTTRLSSDSDKMPTLEPAVQATNSDEYVDAAANDLPILSPATPSSGSEKALRGKGASKNTEDKESQKKASEAEERKSEVAGDLQEEEKDPRQGKTRRGKADGKNLEKGLKGAVHKAEVSKEKLKGFNKERFKRRGAPGRVPSGEEKKTGGSKSPEETKKEFRQRKEDGAAKTLETRSNSKSKLDKILDADGQIQIQNVPFEVKKLIGSDSKEDLLTKLVLTARTAASKRCLRQSTPRVNLDQGKSKTRTDSEAEKASLDSELNSNASAVSKKESVGLRRKSLRNSEKKSEEKVPPKDDKSAAEEASKTRGAASEVKSTARGRRSNSQSGENKSAANANRTSPVESQNKTEAELTSQTADNESSSNKRQTRGSVLNNEVDSRESSSDQHDAPSEKSSHLGKRRGRIKSSNDVPDKGNAEVSQAKSEELVKNNVTETIVDKINTPEENNAKPIDKEAAVEDNNASEDKEEKDRSGVKAELSDGASLDRPATPNANSSLNHLQLETSGSMDSGKENSVETVVAVQKLKVGRPRKSWGSRRERTSKRSLNNVIGILTEGMNIPVESQQSVVLTVQTNLDNDNTNAALENNAPESDDGGAKPVTSDQADKPSETVNNTVSAVEESRSCIQDSEADSRPLQAAEESAKKSNAEDSSANTQKADSPSDTKEQSPTNDIILDLSRRKTKGKGSFLEKIVSKIAKQKDALLEGEVGSLLDTAADELTSILDEVGPGLAEATENSADAKNEAGKSKTDEKTLDRRQKAKEKSVDKELPLAGSSSDKKLEANDTEISKPETIENEERNTLEEKESPTGIMNDSGSINQTGIKESIACTNREATNQQIETLEVQRNANSDNPKVEGQAAPAEINSAANGILLSATESAADSTVKTQPCAQKQEDRTARRDEVIQDSKSKRKSKKRSLERNSPKKNKRKSVEATDEPEETPIPEELHLADIMKLIDKSKQVPSTKENAEDGSSEAAVQPGKRKTENNDVETNGSVDSEAIGQTETSEDSINAVKKIKMDNVKGAKESEEADEGDKAEKHNAEDPVNESNDQISVDNEETHSALPQTTGKRKSAEAVEQCTEADSSVKRTSKRRSVPEEKMTQPSEEEALSKIEFLSSEATSASSRRRSSRMKSTVQPRSEEKSKKESRDDPNCSISNAVACDSELPLSGTIETDESLENNASLMHTTVTPATEEANKTEESSTASNAESRETTKDRVTESISETDPNGSQTALEAPAVPKVLKKRGRKKKVPVNEQPQITNDFPDKDSNSKIEAEPADDVSGKKSSRTSRADEEAEKDGKNAASNAPSASLEHFKIPEVTDVLQHTKKRTSKRKSVTDEHLDSQSALPSTEAEANSAECSEVNKTFAEKEVRLESRDQKESTGGRRRLSRNSNKEKLELERSSSSGSIDLVQSSRTRSSKRKQLSSEDLLGQEGLNRRAESVDSLSETSVVSESSYFRKKRFSKKKKGFQAPPDDVQTDTSVTDSESIDTERNTDRRQSLKRRAKKNISFFELQFDLVDDFDIPMDIEACLQPDDSLKDIGEGLESKSSRADEKLDNETMLNETSDREQVDKTVADAKQTVEEEENAAEGTENADSKVDAAADVQDDFQTPKKRAAGNFVVVHKKTGEILIVEKRKKLTKEAAKFFCDVCATSFTRKSSLKKHNLSQSHLLQLAKSKKDKAFNENAEETCAGNWKEASDQNETSNDESTSVTNELIGASDESKEDEKDLKPDSKDSELAQDISTCTASIEQDSLIASQTTQQRIVEDELLDEEICKITENMSHDEYVLTEHSSPTPESSSTPINVEVKKMEDGVKKKKHDKKKEKGKKKNLMDELPHLDADEPKTLLNLTSGPLQSVLGSNISIKISKSLHSSTIESPARKKEISDCDETISSFADSVKNLEFRPDVSVLKENSLASMTEKSLGIESGNEMSMEQNKEAESQKDHATIEKISRSASNDKLVSKENQPHERISLKLTINRRSIEQFREANTEINRGLNLNYSQKAEDVECYSSQCSVEEPNYLKPKSNQHARDTSSTLPKTLEEDNRNLDNTVEGLNDSKETSQTVDTGKIVDEGVETSSDVLNNLYNQQTLMVTENAIEDMPKLQTESSRASKHSKSKKNKLKKHAEEVENVSVDSPASRKASKSKGNHHKQTSDEVAKPSDAANNQESNERFETFECKIIDKTDNKKSELLENNSDKGNNLASLAVPEAEVYKLDASVIENQQKVHPNLETSKDASQAKMVEGNEDNVDPGYKVKRQLTVEEEDSLSSIEDKPLSQVLLEVDEKMKEEKKQKRGRETSVNSFKYSEVSKHEDEEHSKATFDVDETCTPTNQRPEVNELTNGEQVESQAACKEKCEPETLLTVKTSDKDAKVSSESENSETIRQMKETSSEKEAKVASNDHKKVSKSHKHSSKDGHRKFKNKKASLKNKIADLTSESDDSEYEDKMGSQNKSKIVKSVFGRVFGGEKTDKVKEVLNDWVSKSEDDSDAPRAEFGSFSPNESRTREVSDAKGEGKNAERQTAASMPASPKKSSGKKSKKSSSSDAAKEKSLDSEDHEDLRSDKRAESQSNSNNRRKSNVDIESLLRQHCDGEILPPTSHRSSKKKAKKKITQEILSWDNLLDRVDGKPSWESKSEDDSDGSRSELKISSPSEVKSREVAEVRTENDAERQSNSRSSSPKKRSGKKSKKSSDRTKEKDLGSENQEDHRTDKTVASKDNAVDHRKHIGTDDEAHDIASATSHKSSRKKTKKRSAESHLPHGTLFERMETKYWASKSDDDSDASRNDFKPSSPAEMKTRESSQAKIEENVEKLSASSKKSSGKKKKSFSSDRAKEKNLDSEDREDLHLEKDLHAESQSVSNNCRKSSVDLEASLQRYGDGEILPPTSHRSSKKRAKKKIAQELSAWDTLLDRLEDKPSWGSKSEDDSDDPDASDELKTKELSDVRAEKDAERLSNSTASSPKKRSGKKSKRSYSDKMKEKDLASESQEDHRSDKAIALKDNLIDHRKNDADTEDETSETASPTNHKSSKKRAKKRSTESHIPHGTLFERMETKYNWGSKSDEDLDAVNPVELKTRESSEARIDERNAEKESTSYIPTGSKKSSGKKSKKSSSSDGAKEKNLDTEDHEDSHSDKRTESQSNSSNHKKSNVDMEQMLRRHCDGEIQLPTSHRVSKKKARKKITQELTVWDTFLDRMDGKFSWGSKSEDDSDASQSESKHFNPNETKTRGASEDRLEKDVERQCNSTSSSPKKRSGKKSSKSSSSEKARERNTISENQENRRSDKHTESKNSLTSRRKNDVSAEHEIPSVGYRNSKRRAEEISKSFSPLDYIYDSKESSELRNQNKSDLTVKDSGYGSFNYDEDSSKLVSLEDSTDDQKTAKRRKSDDLTTEKKTAKGSKASDDEDASSVKDLSRDRKLANVLSVDLESSQSCPSLAPSSVRNRSPSMDRNSQTTKDSDVDEEDRDEEEMGRRRISPLFVCGIPRSSISSSSSSENEDEDEHATVGESGACKRSSSEFSGEKIVIRSPSSTHKTEVVTIAPTDAIEDNALDVPQEIETAKPRQGKVLNFDEELFVECCSRLKATTENELRGAKKIKLDHNEGYHKQDDQQEGLKGPRDRWRDVESQNSLGSLLESVNQLLGEEMYSTQERDYPKRGGRNARSEYSSRSASPDMSRVDNLGYEDSLDVAFEHNNKLRDKIQQRIRESESLIASTFGQKSSSEIAGDDKRAKDDEQVSLRNSYSHLQDQEHQTGTNLSNGDYSDSLHARGLQEQQSPKKMSLESSGFKNRMNSALGGLLDKALSNLLHSNGKNDQNGSTPMKVLAELACARAPTSTAGDSASQEDVQSVKTIPSKDSVPNSASLTISKDTQKKTRNPIKELFERKKEMNERKQQEKSKTEAALRELNVHRQRKTKKAKKHQDFPLIRRNEHGGLVERKKRRDGFERKEEFASDRIKDVYEFDEEESQMEPNLGSVMSYRSRPGYEVNCLKTKEVDVAALMSKAIGDSLENGKAGDPLSSRLESIIDNKFKELEKFAPKTKGALKAFQSEEQQQRHMTTGPMDDFVERKQSQSKRPAEQSLKHPKLKKRNKNPRKKNRNAWYENDSSDEYRTAVKAEGVGVGISKSQRTCSKGKQNIFAELYTSSESEFENDGLDYEAKRQKKAKKGTKKIQELESIEQSQELINKYCSENEDNVDEWGEQDLKDDVNKTDCDNKKSESEMSDHPLVIDERKDTDDQRNSDEETENQYERNFELDDLYREDSSVVDSDVEDSAKAENAENESEVKNADSPREKLDDKVDYIQEDELIPLEEALDLLDQADKNLETNYDNVNKEVKSADDIDTTPAELVNKTFDAVEESPEKPGSVEDQEEEPDNDLLSLPEKLSTNEKPQKESDNLPLHVFLSRKVQESKKRKEQQLKKMQEEQERILMDFQPTRRQRKCAIGKQGLLAEISSSDEEMSPRDNRKSNDKSDHEKPRKQKRESKEKRKERYIEKKHEQMIAKEQKAIEEEILRELGKKKESFVQNATDVRADSSVAKEPESIEVQEKINQEQKKKNQVKEKQKKPTKVDENTCVKNNNEDLNDLEKKTDSDTNHKGENTQDSPAKQRKHSKSPTKPKKSLKGDPKTVNNKKGKNPVGEKSKNRTDSKGLKDKECKSANNKRDSDDEELKTTKSWNKVEEGVGVAIGRRKRAAANQLYYWSSSSDDEEMLEVVPAVEEEEDDRQEQHGWIVGDSHKKMITMLAMEKQLKEKRRRSEDEFEPSKAKSKKHRNSTS